MRSGAFSPVLIAVSALALIRVAGAAPVAAAADGSANQVAQAQFRVCADPNNLPFSNQAKAGFENKLADLFAAQLGESVTYAWHAQREGFVRQTLNAKKCDVIMGVPEQYGLVETTRPYYRSTYVFVSRADRHIDIQSLKDGRLHSLKIGVQLIGADGDINTPPAHALAAEGNIDNIVGFPVYGDYRQPNPPARIVSAVEDGKIDIAAVWGPLAGYFAKISPVPLAVRPMTDTASFAPLLFQFDIAMGVRKGDDARRAKLNDLIAQNHARIGALLESYGIPMVATIKQSSLESDAVLKK